MKNKKGILLPETLKIIIAVLCIALLIVLAVKLYGLFFKKTALEQAKENIKNLYSKIERIEKNESKEESFIMESPNGWQLFAYGGGSEKPKDCNKNCICLCPVPGYGSDNLKECNNLGVCKNTVKKIRTIYKLQEQPILIQKPTELKLQLDGEEIVIAR